jgi:protein-S-isoprenylcysteine O-methyltransferase Ste14
MNDRAASNPVDHAGVPVPPPLIYIVLFGVGLLLHWLVPFSFVPTIPARVVALIFLGCGVILVVWSGLLFRRANTSVVPVKPTTALVISGPYRLTRNPIYLAFLCIYIAAALGFGVIWALVLVPLVVLAVQRLAISKEERYLEQKFGDAYRQYRAHVRRWI